MDCGDFYKVDGQDLYCGSQLIAGAALYHTTNSRPIVFLISHTTRSHTTPPHHHATFSKLCTLYYSFQTVHTTPDPLCTTPATLSSLCTTLNQCKSTSTVQVRTSTVQARTTTRCSMAPPGSAPDLCLWPRLSPYQPPLGFHQTDLLFVLTTPHPPHSYPQAKQTQMQQCSPASYM